MADKDYTFTIVTKDEGGGGAGKGKSPPLGQPWDYQDEGGKMLRPGQPIPGGIGSPPRGTGQTLSGEAEGAEGVAATMALRDQGTTVGGAGGASIVGRPGAAGGDEDDQPSRGWVELLKDTGRTLGGVFTGSIRGLGALIGGIPGPPDSGTMDASGVSAIKGIGAFYSGTLKRAGGVAQGVAGHGARFFNRGSGDQDAADSTSIFAEAVIGAADIIPILGEAAGDAAQALGAWISWIDSASAEIQAFHPGLMMERVTTSLELLFKKMERAAIAGDELMDLEIAKRDLLLRFEDFKTDLIVAFAPLLMKLMEVAEFAMDHMKVVIEFIADIMGRILIVLVTMLDWMWFLMDAAVWFFGGDMGYDPDSPVVKLMKGVGEWLIAFEMDELDRRDRRDNDWKLFDNWLNNPNRALRAIIGAPGAGDAPGGANAFPDV